MRANVASNDSSGRAQGSFCAFCNQRFAADASVCPACQTGVGLLVEEAPPTEPGTARHSRPIHLPQLRLGDFVLSRPLGRGGMGMVYLAEREDGAQAAVKILHPQFMQDYDIVRRFLQEARLVKQLDHPNIVRLYDCGFSKELGYYLMLEHLQGETLQRVLSQHTFLPSRYAVDLMFPILGALSVAHTKNIIHCDLKPANIFLVGSLSAPIVKLLDFGVAKSISQDNVSVTRTGAMLGTPEYMSPEQSFGRKTIDHRSDLYSLATILFELVTGRRPFLAKTPSELMVKRYRDKAEPASSFAPDLPKELDTLLLACLEKDPENRPQSAQEVARDLRALYPLLPEETYPDSLLHAWGDDFTN